MRSPGGGMRCTKGDAPQQDDAPWNVKGRLAAETQHDAAERKGQRIKPPVVLGSASSGVMRGRG